MHLLRLLVPAIALALAPPTAVAAGSPSPSVPLDVTGTVLSCDADGGCAYVLTVRRADAMPQVLTLELTDDGRAVHLGGRLDVPVGPIDITVTSHGIADVVTDGRRELGAAFAQCDVPVDVPADGRGLDLAVAATHRACLLEIAPSERMRPEEPPDPASALLVLHRLPDSVDPAMGLPPHVTVEPRSLEDVPVGVPFAAVLGHCGLASALDLDGTLWDPIGGVDATLGPVDTQDEIGELINATQVEALVVTPDRLDLRTPLGTVVVMARHEGPGEYPLCD